MIKNNERTISVIEYAKHKGVLKYSTQSVETEEGRKSGYSSEDVTGFWKINLKSLINGNIETFKEMKEEFGFWKALSFLHFSLTVSGWTWVIDSKDAIKHELTMMKIREGRKNNYDQYKEVYNTITEENINEYLNEHYTKITPSLYVSNTDSTVMVYDEKLKPFALPDGWTTNQLGEILEEWIEHVGNVRVKAEHIEGAEW